MKFLHYGVSIPRAFTEKHVFLGVDDTIVGKHKAHANGVLCKNTLIKSWVLFTVIILKTDYQNLQGENKRILHLICLDVSCHSLLFVSLLEGITKLISERKGKKFCKCSGYQCIAF